MHPIRLLVTTAMLTALKASPVGFESRCLCMDDGGKCFPGDDAIRGDDGGH